MTKIQNTPEQTTNVVVKATKSKTKLDAPILADTPTNEPLPLADASASEPLPLAKEPKAKKAKKLPEEPSDLEDNEAELEDENTREELKARAKRYVRIGDNYYKIVYRPDKEGKPYKDYMKLQKGTIIDDHKHAILKYISKYDDFCMVASHTNFRQVINGFYNEYSELTHKVSAGNCDTIHGIVRHVFGDYYYEFALDYLQILYTDPYQRLPILLLESQERNTGKSTFANVVYRIFQDNAIKIGNNDLQSDFNAVWAKKLLIVIDEASIEKKIVTQMLKRLSTEKDKITVNEKNKAQAAKDFFGKFIFISNEEGRALFIEPEENRYAVFRVPTFAQNGIKDDPLIDDKIAQEIPAFLHFLANRTLRHERKSRMYFDPFVYQTPQLQLYYDNSISKVAQSIKRLVQDTFDLYPEETVLKFGTADLIEELKSEIRYINREHTDKALQKELKIMPKQRTHYTLFSRKNSELNSHYVPIKNDQNKVHYCFERATAEYWKNTNEFF